MAAWNNMASYSTNAEIVRLKSELQKVKHERSMLEDTVKQQESAIVGQEQIILRDRERVLAETAMHSMTVDAPERARAKQQQQIVRR